MARQLTSLRSDEPRDQHDTGRLSQTADNIEVSRSWVERVTVHMKNYDALVAAGRKVLDGLNARIQRATDAGGTVPLFDGIGELHDALNKAAGKETQ